MTSEPSDETTIGGEKAPGASAHVGSLGVSEERGVAAKSSSETGSPTALPLRFGMRSLLLTMTLLCVCLIGWSILPQLGFGMTIVLAPAFLRTAIYARRLERRGAALDAVECLATFFGSCGVVLAIQFALLATFYGSCLAGFTVMLVPTTLSRYFANPLDGSLAFGVLTGVIAASALAVWLLRRFGGIKLPQPRI